MPLLDDVPASPRRGASHLAGRRSQILDTLFRGAVLSGAPAPHWEFIFYDGLGSLPHFNPDLDADDNSPPDVVKDFRRLLIGADAVVISSPEYAHGVPGALKNAIDWLVSVGALVGKPVLLLNASAAGGEHAQASLMHTLRVMNWNVLEESLTAPFLRKRGEVDDEAATKIRASLDALARAIAG